MIGTNLGVRQIVNDYFIRRNQSVMDFNRLDITMISMNKHLLGFRKM